MSSQGFNNFNITFYIHSCHVLFGLFSISFIYAAIHPKMLNCVLFSMVGLGFHSVVFGLTYGAHSSAFVPVIKVPANIFFIKNPFQGWQLTEFLYKASWLPLQAISEEVTVSMGLVCFSTATGSLIGPLAVSNQYNLRDIYYDMVFVFPRWVGYTTPMAPTARASLEAAHLGSLEPLFWLPLPLSCLPEKLKYIDHRSRRKTFTATAENFQ